MEKIPYYRCLRLSAELRADLRRAEKAERRGLLGLVLLLLLAGLSQYCTPPKPLPDTDRAAFRAAPAHSRLDWYESDFLDE